MILVTGATGTNGKEVVKLLSKGGAQVKAMVRKKADADSIRLPGVEVVEGDFAAPESLKGALQGVDRAFLLTPYVPDQVSLQTEFVKAAKAAGVKHLVKFSVWGADTKSTASIMRQHGEIEKFIESAGLPYTFLRPNSFMQNFFSSAATIAQGALYAPAGDSRVSVVDARDNAAVAARALTESGHEGKTYEITGPEALTHAQAAAKLGAVIGKTVNYVSVAPEQFKATLLQYGVPEWMADGLNELYAYYVADKASRVTDTVERVAGKSPITFDQFAKDHASVFKGK